MKFKLDENFGTRTQQLFCTAGHDVKTVREQGLEGCSDIVLYEMCCSEKRCLVTFDLHFADVPRFPPDKASGIVVIRVPRNPTLELLKRMVQQFLVALEKWDIGKSLWIVEVGRIRIHKTELFEDI